MSAPGLDAASLRVLVLAPFGRDSELLSRVLHAAHITAEPCENVSALCAGITDGAGAVLVADEALASDGFRQLTHCLGRQEPWSDLPLFLMTQQNGGRESARRLDLLEPLGNVTILERPLRGETLVSSFRMGLRARKHQYQLRSKLQVEQKAAQAIRESEIRFRTLAESMPHLVWTCDANGACDYLSRQWLDYTGETEASQLGYEWLNCVHPDDRLATQEAWGAACRAKSRYDVEFRLRGADGTYRWFETRATPSLGENGSVRKWFGSCTDIEEQKRISEERLTLLAAEKRARELAQLLNRVGPALLQDLDSVTLSQTVTNLATQLTGAQFGALFEDRTGSADGALELTAVSGAPPDAVARLAPDRQGASVVFSEDITHQGSNVPAAAAAAVRSYLSAPMFSRSGEVTGSLVFGSPEAGVFNVTHAKLAEGIAAQAAIALENARLFAQAQEVQESLRRSNRELRRANEDLNQFAYSASHDLQEPLRMVALYSQMMQRKYGDVLDKTGVEYLNYLVQGARRMELLLHDLLDYTQVVSAQDEFTGLVDANTALQTVLQNLSGAITESAARIESETLPQLPVKEFHLIQLFQNLIGNAIKYRSAAAPLIAVSVVQDDGWWTLRVQDNGIGIEPQYAQQVFGLFRRLHASSRYEGTGIGLAICQKIVERYGGRIWVESEGEATGSAFCFRLPAE